ncbi:MAG: TnpV protein [Lachnospiraceae bacterium]|nr:TnpV protein [Lachnospiraceae bacterium]
MIKSTDTGHFEIGIYGQRHLYFLQHYCRITYINLLTSGKFNEYLVKTDSQAQERFIRIVGQMKQE